MEQQLYVALSAVVPGDKAKVVAAAATRGPLQPGQRMALDAVLPQDQVQLLARAVAEEAPLNKTLRAVVPQGLAERVAAALSVVACVERLSSLALTPEVFRVTFYMHRVPVAEFVRNSGWAVLHQQPNPGEIDFKQPLREGLRLNGFVAPPYFRIDDPGHPLHGKYGMWCGDDKVKVDGETFLWTCI